MHLFKFYLCVPFRSNTWIEHAVISDHQMKASPRSQSAVIQSSAPLSVPAWTLRSKSITDSEERHAFTLKSLSFFIPNSSIKGVAGSCTFLRYPTGRAGSSVDVWRHAANIPLWMTRLRFWPTDWDWELSFSAKAKAVCALCSPGVVMHGGCQGVAWSTRKDAERRPDGLLPVWSFQQTIYHLAEKKQDFKQFFSSFFIFKFLLFWGKNSLDSSLSQRI